MKILIWAMIWLGGFLWTLDGIRKRKRNPIVEVVTFFISLYLAWIVLAWAFL